MLADGGVGAGVVVEPLEEVGHAAVATRRERGHTSQQRRHIGRVEAVEVQLAHQFLAAVVKVEGRQVVGPEVKAAVLVAQQLRHIDGTLLIEGIVVTAGRKTQIVETLQQVGGSHTVARVVEQPQRRDDSHHRMAAHQEERLAGADVYLQFLAVRLQVGAHPVEFPVAAGQHHDIALAVALLRHQPNDGLAYTLVDAVCVIGGHKADTHMTFGTSPFGSRCHNEGRPSSSGVPTYICCAKALSTKGLRCSSQVKKVLLKLTTAEAVR